MLRTIHPHCHNTRSCALRRSSYQPCKTNQSKAKQNEAKQTNTERLTLDIPLPCLCHNRTVEQAGATTSSTYTVGVAAFATLVVVVAGAVLATRHMRAASATNKCIQTVEPTDEDVFGPDAPTHFYPTDSVVGDDSQATRVCETAV